MTLVQACQHNVITRGAVYVVLNHLIIHEEDYGTERHIATSSAYIIILVSSNILVLSLVDLL